jgi:methyl-accepting chemotaxis protein
MDTGCVLRRFLQVMDLRKGVDVDQFNQLIQQLDQSKQTILQTAEELTQLNPAAMTAEQVREVFTMSAELMQEFVANIDACIGAIAECQKASGSC